MSQSRAKVSALLVLSYLPILGFIALIAGKRDREIRWHAVNGLLLFGAVAAIGIVATIIGVLVPPLSCVYPIVMFLVLILYVIIAILAVVKALAGERLIVPVISRYADRF